MFKKLGIYRAKTAIIAALLCASAVQVAKAQDESANIRPVMSTWSVGIGSSHLADTYLSPLKYSGWSTSLSYQRLQSTKKWSGNWLMHLKISADMDRTENPARNATMWSVQVHASWGMMRKWSLPFGFSGGIGPALRVEGGCLYNARNSNNPASAKGAVTIDASAFIARTCKIGKLPVVFMYQPTLPVIGAFFSPKYDELYYEMYLGNHSGLVHPAWFGNRFKINNAVTADLWLGSTALRIGYECDWMNSKVSNLTTRHITHSFIIGVTLNRISVKPTAKTPLPL